MGIKTIKTTVASVWVVAALVVGFALDVTSGSSRLVMAALALLPPLVMWHFWNAPDKTMSESIQDSRR